jgi:hypothetical protein
MISGTSSGFSQAATIFGNSDNWDRKDLVKTKNLPHDHDIHVGLISF